MKALLMITAAMLISPFAVAEELEVAGVMVGQGGSNVCLYKEKSSDTIVYALYSNEPCPLNVRSK
ncbi:hypothetical protein [Vibrio hangzhouensis]|uniref:hypothetical protein n=1 Tax=Vibrio hangzhouensis TaxID=462991 RepID=UPI001C9801B3|nr:hypothetical protein [Vibrio hangzhouensis]MBY6198244.1 hypothetical protein [Vibrio hangzhouensis]